MKRRGKVFLIVLLAVVGLSALSLWLIAEGRFPIKRISKIIQPYISKTPKNLLELQGNVEVREVRLGFRVAGRISHMYVKEGDRVSPGKLLAEIEPSYFKDAVKRAEAVLKLRMYQLLKLKNGVRPEEIKRAKANTRMAWVTYENAKKRFLRAKRLISKGIISRQDFDNIKAAFREAEARLRSAEATQRLVELGPRKEDIEMAQASVEEAKAMLAEARQKLMDTKLYSPVKGVIQTRIHEVGDFVGVGVPVYIISIDNPAWIRAYVNEVQLGSIYPGMKVTVLTDAGKKFVGQIGFISPVAEFTPKTVQTKDTRTDLVYRIRIVVNNSKGGLRQGMPVSIIIRLKGEK